MVPFLTLSSGSPLSRAVTHRVSPASSAVRFSMTRYRAFTISSVLRYRASNSSLNTKPAMISAAVFLPEAKGSAQAWNEGRPVVS